MCSIVKVYSKVDGKIRLSDYDPGRYPSVEKGMSPDGVKLEYCVFHTGKQKGKYYYMGGGSFGYWDEKERCYDTCEVEAEVKREEMNTLKVKANAFYSKAVEEDSIYERMMKSYTESFRGIPKDRDLVMEALIPIFCHVKSLLVRYSRLPWNKMEYFTPPDRLSTLKKYKKKYVDFLTSIDVYIPLKDQDEKYRRFKREKELEQRSISNISRMNRKFISQEPSPRIRRLTMRMG